jgi:hypothetical protein
VPAVARIGRLIDCDGSMRSRQCSPSGRGSNSVRTSTSASETGKAE